MTKNLDNDGLQSIVNNYDLFYIDLWGVVHNGIQLHTDAINVLKNEKPIPNLKLYKNSIISKTSTKQVARFNEFNPNEKQLITKSFQHQKELKIK